MTIALVDCNSFYCSVETSFQPWLRDRPVCVSSSNDGCVVARNDHAKKIGIKMSQPVFELRHLVEQNKLILFSSNYELYQSLSNRVMAILESQAPRSFCYSIDESFCALDGIADPLGWAQETQAMIKQRLGLDVGVGISNTATLAKLANWAAKKWKAQTGCVVDLRDPVRRDRLLNYAPVNEVWGIGRRLTEHLGGLGINTAWQLASADPKFLRRHFNVNVERTARELLGVACIDISDTGTGRKQMIISSRSFGQRITTLEPLLEAVASFVSIAAAKLRLQGSLANCIQVFARASPFASGQPYSASRIIALPAPTDDTRDLLSAAVGGLRDLYRPGVEFAKAGIVLSQFSQRGAITGDLFAPAPRRNSDALMAVMDSINARQGRGSIRLARDTATGPWKMHRQFLTPPYTTSWDALPKARC
ncbi:translesion error-prone DNA polymerase V subunit UmuC [Pseudomonas sp. UMAB-40]|uniref:translesion error-prone DNA polymerase V subunit UmuC n=1 Tax=Pseudomonas sp. UMAB-40 TaxID=1365407 RepID=UPI001C57BABF|nr:translesion error-prone DNA polymerase V subunit UmuC [Pseudomonas sp. UMAB-40]